MENSTESIISLYKEHLEKIKKLDFAKCSKAEQKWHQDELQRTQIHIERLENNHRDCVKRCCPGCLLGGLSMTKRFGNAISEQVCFRESQKICNEYGKSLYGYFDADGSYVLTDSPPADVKDGAYHEIYQPQ